MLNRPQQFLSCSAEELLDIEEEEVDKALEEWTKNPFKILNKTFGNKIKYNLCDKFSLARGQKHSLISRKLQGTNPDNPEYSGFI